MEGAVTLENNRNHRCRRTSSIYGKGSGKAAGETVARGIFLICACFTVFVVASMIFYLLINGIPALKEVGLREILFGTVWKPTAAEPSYGIFNVILTSLAGTFLAVVLGVPAGILTAVFLAEASWKKSSPGKRLAGAVRSAVELLAGIPSVIYGLLGIYLLCPLVYRLERKLFAGSGKHQFTGGANLLSAVLVLAVMILPTVINVSETAIRAVGREIREASLALGASRVQTVFRAVLPAAKSGIATAVVLGVGRAMGEAMALMVVSGNRVNVPLPFRSVRFLTTAIVSEMAYSQGIHRQVLFTIGLVLLGFIMLVQFFLNRIWKKGSPMEKEDGRK